MAIQKIDFFGQVQPTGVNTGSAELLQQSANLFQGLMQQEQQKVLERAEIEGREAGLQAVQETGAMPELESDYTIRGQAFNQASKLAYASQVRTDARKQIARMKLESQTPEEFISRSKAYINETTQGLPIDLQSQLTADLNNASATAQIQLETDFYNRTMNENLALVNEELEGTVDDILNAYNAGDIEQAGRLESQLETVLDGAVQTGLIQATQKQSLLNKAKEESEKELYLGEMDRIVGSALPLSERIKASEALVNRVKEADLNHLNPRQKDSLIASLAAKTSNLSVELKKAQAQEVISNNREVSNLKVAANTGQGDLGELVAKTESLFDSGLIKESERTSILTKLVKRQQEEIEKQERFELVAQRIGGDDTILVDQKSVDEVFDEAIEPMLQELPPLERNAQLANIISETHIVPTKVKAQLNNSLNTRDPEMAKESLDLIARIEQVPGVDLGIPKNQEAYAEKLVELSAIMPEAEAIDLAQRATDPKDQDRIALVREQIKEAEYDYSEIVDDEIDGLNDINKERAAKEYKRIFESYMEAGLDESMAEEKTVAKMSANWKESEAAGMTIKNPPEQYYTVAGDSQYIRDQLLKDVFSQHIFGESNEDVEVFLQSDDVTAREASKGKPSYNVIIFSPESGLMTLPNRWKPDMQSQIQKVNEEQLEKHGRAREQASKSERQRNREFLSTIGQGL